ncbi:hypothetical protein O181_010783 [Austropuccinia psidii MF-1]|uniref:Uncharacterized protein n=1 Tax=Austropuccinia psidii MF-1 TaxID=1389203 RepID=A0A9Q3GKP8_9BASI|nr:hypothetical protein [Austropuccinia psidii MF-1]
MESAKQDLSFRNEFAPQHFLNEIEKIPMPHSQDDEELNSNGEDHEQNTHVTLNSNIISGVIPSPNQPDMVTIKKVLKPLIDELIELNCGVKIITPNHPRGRYVVVKLVGLVGDIVASHKAGGFMSHSAKYFCSWCEMKDIERTHLKLGKPRKRNAVLIASRRWQEAKTKTAQQRLEQYCGIQWSEINHSPYWDSFKNICLEKEKHQPGISGYESNELMENCTQSKNEDNLTISGYLPQEVINKLKKQLSKVVVPKGVCHLPGGIGTARNGKLKGNEWSVLFNIYLPLTVLEIFWDLGPKNHLVLINIGALIQCTKIVGAQWVTEDNGHLFRKAYDTYQNTSKALFPNCWTLPNHHYAMHIPEQLSRWGPLNGISEYGGERLVGILQKIKTNSLQGATEETMMKKFGQLQRLQQVNPQLNLIQLMKTKSPIVNSKALDDKSYLNILQHLQKEQPHLRYYRKIPHPPQRRPNNLIYSKKGEKGIQFGYISHILDLGNEDIHEGPIVMVHWLRSVKKCKEGFEGVEEFLDQWGVQHLKKTYLFGFMSVADICGLAAYIDMRAWSLGCKNIMLLACRIDKLVGLEQFE